MGAAWVRQARARMVRYRRQGEPLRSFGDMRDQARQAYGEWFERLGWDTFDTFTLVLGARESAYFAWRALARWSASMQTVHGRQLRQVVALEWQHRGTAHLHALSYGYRDVSLDAIHQARRFWEDASGGGHARVWPYEASGGAAAYCSKYVTKDMELRLLGPWPPYQAAVQAWLVRP